MSLIEITGGKKLCGEIEIHGSKNAVLPILAASLLHKGISVIHHCPDISDVRQMCLILQQLGCKVKIEKDTIIIDASVVNKVVLSGKEIKEMRSSIILAGALAGRNHVAQIAFPGGCMIGARPVNLHLDAFRKLNITVMEQEDLLECTALKILGNDIVLPFPSVGATENTILAAVLGTGSTKITGAAKEPEIVELCNFLCTMGAKIKGAGTDVILISGVDSLHDTEYTVCSDRIVAGTYLTALAGTGGEVTLKNATQENLESVIQILEEMGADIQSEGLTIHAGFQGRAKNIAVVTGPYPEFPTDMQSQLMSVCAVAKGTSNICETIFEDRYKNIDELKKMGALIETAGKCAYITGVKKLHGADICAWDLRGGAGLVIAGLMAEGITTIHNSYYIERGYVDIVKDLNELGASVRIVKE